MKAVAIASRAARAWAVTPVGAYKLLRMSPKDSAPLHRPSTVIAHLHSSSISRSDHGKQGAGMRHEPLLEPSTSNILFHAEPFQQSRAQKARARRRRRDARRRAAAMDVQVEESGTVEHGAGAGPLVDHDPNQDGAAIDSLESNVPVDDLIAKSAIPAPSTDQATDKTAALTKAERRTLKLRLYRKGKRERERSRSMRPPAVYEPAPPASPRVNSDTPSVTQGRNKAAAKAPAPSEAVETTERETRVTGAGLHLPPHETSLSQGTISAVDVTLREVKPERPMKIATLRSDLSRVLFSPGVHHLRDPRSGVRNFGESLDAIPNADEFAVERTPTYVPPSRHQELLDLAGRAKARFIGSTSTLTKAFSQIWFTINGGRELDFSKFSQEFADANKTYTHGAELPAVLTLTPLQGCDANGDKIWAIDSDKAYDIENALSDYGRVLEKQLTAEDADFVRFLRSSPDSSVSQEERNEAEAYRYRRAGSILMRSQLDCHDERLPGTGVFDIKTRACHPLRHDRANVEQGSGHDVYRERGMGNTFERELYDLVRSAMLKFSMQVRIGDMDGIFLAYHNTARMFGFQYLPLSDMDEYLFGSTQLADQAFNLSISIFERIVQHVTSEIDGDEPISIMMYKTPRTSGPLKIYFGPASQDRPTHAIRLRTANEVDGEPATGAISFGDRPIGRQWSVNYKLSTYPIGDAQSGFSSCVNMLRAMCTLSVPSGKTVGEMYALGKAKERETTSTGPKGQDSGKSDSQGVLVGSGGVEDVMLENEISTSAPIQERREQDGIAAPASSASTKAYGQPKVRVRWIAPNGRVQALRREVDASKELYEERKKGWSV